MDKATAQELLYSQVWRDLVDEMDLKVKKLSNELRECDTMNLGRLQGTIRGIEMVKHIPKDAINRG